MLSNVGQLQFEDEIESIRKEANHLKSQGVNIIIAVGHSGFDKDREIAREVEEVDLVVGGHTNTFLYSGKIHYYYDTYFRNILCLIGS